MAVEDDGKSCLCLTAHGPAEIVRHRTLRQRRALLLGLGNGALRGERVDRQLLDRHTRAVVIGIEGEPENGIAEV